jgi:hypothetical protein
MKEFGHLLRKGNSAAATPCSYVCHTTCPWPTRRVRRSRLFGQLPGRNKLKAGSRLVVWPFPEI